MTANYFYMQAYASDKTPNTFIASVQNIFNIEQQASPTEYEKSAATFSEFTEDAIDKNGFYIRIDKVGLFKKVVKDVDPRYKEVYVKSWDTGVSHSKFTSYPDKIGITYLFSHATGDKSDAINQKAWFSNLDQLQNGDTVILYYEGSKYTYEVNEIRAVAPKVEGILTGVSPVAKVRLQYCGPPTGSLASRMIVDGLLIDKQTL